jgi:hypothetical protein
VLAPNDGAVGGAPDGVVDLVPKDWNTFGAGVVEAFSAEETGFAGVCEPLSKLNPPKPPELPVPAPIENGEVAPPPLCEGLNKPEGLLVSVAAGNRVFFSSPPEVAGVPP